MFPNNIIIRMVRKYSENFWNILTDSEESYKFLKRILEIFGEISEYSVDIYVQICTNPTYFLLYIVI